MEQKVFKVTFYKRPNGNEPMTDHLDSLDIKMRVKVLRSLSILQEKGNELRYPERDCSYAWFYQKDAKNSSTGNR